MHNIENMLQARIMFCLQARPCTFQPGKFTGCGSEGVKGFGYRSFSV